MAITLTVPVDQLTLNQLIADGFTSLTLWYADEPDGTFADSSVTSDPSTLAAAADDEAYTFTFSFTAGTPTQWFKIRAKQGVTYSDAFLSSAFQGGAGVSLKYLRRRLGYMLGDMAVFSTTSAGTTTTAVSNRFALTRRADSYFVNKYLYRVATAEEGLISASTQGGTLTFAPAHALLVGSGAEVEVTGRWTREDYIRAINWACVEAYPILSRPIMNTGFLTIDDAHTYAVPHDILKLNSVEIESRANGSSTDATVRGQPWIQLPHKLVSEGLQQRFELDSSEYEDRRMRLTGIGFLSQMSSDDDSTECQLHNAELLLNLAAHRLYQLLASAAASSDRDFYLAQAAYYLAAYERKRGAHRTMRPPGRMWSPDSRGARRRMAYIGRNGRTG